MPTLCVVAKMIEITIEDEDDIDIFLKLLMALSTINSLMNEE
jgi:hypothetical protein